MMNPRETISRARRATYRKRDVQLLIKIMREAGYQHVKIVVGADGQISAEPVNPATPAAPPERHPWDE